MMMQGVTNETAGSSESGFSFNDVMAMLVLDIFIYAVLAWYATNVRNIPLLAHCFPGSDVIINNIQVCHTLP